MNPKDPLLRVGPEHERELLKALAGDCHGYPIETMANAAANLLINAIRQQAVTRAAAEKMFDELLGRTKTILLDRHYDSTGRKKGVFAYDQVITVPLIDLRE